MKTFNEIIVQDPVYYNNCNYKDEEWFCKEDIITDFRPYSPPKEEIEEYFNQIKDITILFAAKYAKYNEMDVYDVDVYVLFKQKEKLFEVFGWHGSYPRLEVQWDPEEVTLEVLKERLKERSKRFYGGGFYDKELISFLGITEEDFD